VIAYNTPAANAMPSKWQPGCFRLLLRNNFNSIMDNFQAQESKNPADNISKPEQTI
jgi:hypothetical protein